MKTKWTAEQNNAIKARGEQILVTAAAGSGKTAVLTERVKEILCDPDNPCDVSRILVVTFTRAAAGEMRERITAALKEAQNNGGGAYIKRQLTLLPTADICTIDSFCSKLLRDNFHLAEVSQDYTMLDEADEKELLRKTALRITEELYEKNDEGFSVLNKMFLSERDDAKLTDIILALYGFSRAYPDPFLWLDKVSSCFDPEKDIFSTPWAGVVFESCENLFSYYIKRMMCAVTICDRTGDFNEGYVNKLKSTLERLVHLKELSQDRDWNGLTSALSSFYFSDERLSAKKADPILKNYVKSTFDDCKSDILSLAGKELPDEASHKKDCRLLYPAVKTLVSAVKSLTLLVDAEKKRLNSYSFDDILHKCVNMLVVFDGKRFKRTELAHELSLKYEEILIDEYQDTNEAQNIIFEAVSRERKNLYCVGDVKQSIYRFRLASPEIFLNLKKSLSEYDGTIKGSRIALNANFRSRKGVTEAVNFIFSRLMSEKAGDIAYDESERLNFGASYYPEHETPDTELHLLSALPLCSADALKFEAKKAAEYIKSAVERKETVFDKSTGGERPCEYGDFCILLRSVKNKAAVYSKELEKLGIPALCENDAPVSESKEVSLLISLIKTVSNPLLDVPLATVLMSPIFGFTPDDMANMRLLGNERDLYFCLNEYGKSNEKAARFLSKLRLYRNIAAAYPVNDFVKFIVDDTAIVEIYRSLPGGDEREAALKGILFAADSFCERGRNGLSSFVRNLDALCENNSLKRSQTVHSGSAVRIMSIHKSKGLEFPFVLLCNLSSRFNLSDCYGALTVSKETGVGMKIRDDEKFTQYDTVSSFAGEKALKRGTISEELRILYVALTRARERLVLFCTYNNMSKGILEEVSHALIAEKNTGEAFDPYYILNSQSAAQWILSCFAFHSDCDELRKLLGMGTVTVLPSDFKVAFSFEEYKEETVEAKEENAVLAQYDGALLERIKERVEYKYPYDALSSLLAKRTASSMESTALSREYFIEKKPEFLSGGLVGAKKGTAVHKFFELCDFKNAAANLESEIERLVSEGVVTKDEAQVIDKSAVKAFFESPVGKRLLNADKIYKEYKFSVLRPVGFFGGDFPEDLKNEMTVVEGKLDCAFTENKKAVIIDYKTDGLTDESAFINMYKPQLEIYKSAFCECEEVSVDEMYLYSFKLKKFIKV